MLYIISYSYKPDTAETNHNLCYLKGFSELGVEVHYVLLFPNAKKTVWDEPFKGVRVKYLWKRFPWCNKVLCYISYYLFLLFQLKRNDVVLLLGASSFLHSLVKRKGVHVYHERTEHPGMASVSNLSLIKNSYYRDCSKADGLFVISSALKELFIKEGVSSECVHIINMVVDNNRFEGLVKRSESPYVAYCGTASNNKDGVDELIKAFALVSKQYPDLKLYIIGNTPSAEQRSNNLELVKNLGIEDKVIFTGVIPSEQIPQLLKDATILALDRPDNIQAKYGFPTKLGEYLLTGNPVVVTRVGDIPLFLTDGTNALISDPQNAEMFAKKMCWVIEHKEEAKQLGENGKKIADTHFHYLTETNKMVSVMLDDGISFKINSVEQ